MEQHWEMQNRSVKKLYQVGKMKMFVRLKRLYDDWIFKVVCKSLVRDKEHEAREAGFEVRVPNAVERRILEYTLGDGGYNTVFQLRRLSESFIKQMDHMVEEFETMKLTIEESVTLLMFLSWMYPSGIVTMLLLKTMM
ncbi:OLC1v1004988C1 [Oldenlandia corymbosa var. corymbosa]|uniref:OLC1v1004988C1 n=1 Tax=Oldenlandia corymbosa var. corymbosa TaxID=529605 RepID=A0AAV1DFL2_OLDCO|nr:OLC1v1004988C1 [Oldenlandia corymbosa var. corymbosa]